MGRDPLHGATDAVWDITEPPKDYKDFSPPKGPNAPKPPLGDFWWENVAFFTAVHILAVYGAIYISPWYDLKWQTGLMTFLTLHTGLLGMSMASHRLWSHRAFGATMPLQIWLACIACLSFQGSIKWWVLRHQLHHRWTDTEYDPYDATRGLWFSHMGWIFYKPDYSRFPKLDRTMIENDVVVNLQHKYFLHGALFFGFIFPTMLGYLWDDPKGGFIWGGIVSRVLIWQSTFCINSFSHYFGDREYTEEFTARGNFILAVITGGEGNHNYHHAFPRDYRHGYQTYEWDPCKWVVWVLHNYTNMIPWVYVTPQSEIFKAKAFILSQKAERAEKVEQESSLAMWSRFAVNGPGDGIGQDKDTEGELPNWTKIEAQAAVSAMYSRSPNVEPLVVMIDSYVVDMTPYKEEHPGGTNVIQPFNMPLPKKGDITSPSLVGINDWKDATEAFHGGLNGHFWSAREKMKTYRIAKLSN